MPDWLHCMSLGVCQHFLGFLPNEVAACNALQVAGTTASERLEGTARQVHVLLVKWYAAERRAGRERNEVGDLTVGMLGESPDEGVALNGGEANDMLVWCVEFMLPSCEGLRQADTFRVAGAALCSVLRLLRAGVQRWTLAMAQATPRLCSPGLSSW